MISTHEFEKMLTTIFKLFKPFYISLPKDAQMRVRCFIENDLKQLLK